MLHIDPMSTAHDFSLKTITGQEKSLGEYKGRPLLVVNVASKCGFTPQYDGLEKLHKEYGPRGLAVIGIPCNQFGSQEPGSEAEIQEFCRMNFGVSFDLFAKSDVNGPSAVPLYQWLTGSESPAPGAIGWNFEKFLIGKDGKVVKRFSSRIKPESEDLKKNIEAAL